MYSIFVYKNLFFPEKKFRVKKKETIYFLAKLYKAFNFRKYPMCVIVETSDISRPHDIVEWLIPYATTTLEELRKIDKVGDNKDRDDVVKIEDMSEFESNIIMSNKNGRND